MGITGDLWRRLHAVEALWRGAKTPGEHRAAEAALRRLQVRLAERSGRALPVEHRFKMADVWDRQLFEALLARHGLCPYRRPRQRRTTVLVQVATDFVRETLWPEFLWRRRRLRSRLQRLAAEDIDAID